MKRFKQLGRLPVWEKSKTEESEACFAENELKYITFDPGAAHMSITYQSDRQIQFQTINSFALYKL
jgi:hypothetical protein